MIKYIICAVGIAAAFVLWVCIRAGRENTWARGRIDFRGVYGRERGMV